MTRYVMVADLERCVGCQTCTAACRHANATSPAVQWRKVLDLEAGSYPNVSRTFVPVGCQHCEDPPCMHVCPTTATRKRADGIVTVDYDICIGCAYCEMACPYQARFKIESPRFAYGKTAMQNEVARDDPRRIGVSQKCTFCSDRIDAGLADGLVPGLDPEATPACVNSCIADALQFGDLQDSESNVSKLLREQSHFRMHEMLGTEPSFYYLHDKRHADPASTEGQAADSTFGAETASVRSRGVEPRHQQHWDWKAAGNFMCGGAGSGLFAFVALSGIVGAPSVALGLISLGIVAIGLFVLIFKIGRPLRFLYVLRQPQRSWMTREAWIAAAFFPLALLSLGMASDRLAIAAAFLGLLFLFAQAMILKESKGIPAWRSPRVVPLIVTTGLAEGAGLFVIANGLLPTLAPLAIAAAALAALAALRHWAWRMYIGGLQVEGAPIRTLEILGRFRRGFLTWGLAVPMALLTLGFVFQNVERPLFGSAGVLVFATGWALKFVLVTRAAYNQGFAIQRMQAHGSGIATAGVQPGWTFPRARVRSSDDRAAARVR
jgi:Fe-S-cluster-containing dehydrogenase component/DMSO reductase anchor subunit